MTRIYKILSREEWAHAEAAGQFDGSAVDLADGFIHFSAADQAGETLAKHFAGRTGLMLLTIDSETLGSALKWEPSRGGALFPHLYGALPLEAVIETAPIPVDPFGQPSLGALIP